MSKEIDFSKAPEGATHYYLENEDDHFAWAKYVDGKIYISVPAWNDGWMLYTEFYGDHPIKIPAAWSIYTNDKPLCELSDEQAAALFNAWRKGFEIENCLYDEKHEEFVWVNCFSVLSNIEGVYRIKSKSERELFIEKSKLIIGATTDDELVDAVIADLFDSGKFKLVEQQK